MLTSLKTLKQTEHHCCFGLLTSGDNPQAGIWGIAALVYDNNNKLVASKDLECSPRGIQTPEFLASLKKDNVLRETYRRAYDSTMTEVTAVSELMRYLKIMKVTDDCLFFVDNIVVAQILMRSLTQSMIPWKKGSLILIDETLRLTGFEEHVKKVFIEKDAAAAACRNKYVVDMLARRVFLEL